MTIDPQVISLLETLGPPALAVVGTVLGIAATLLCGVARVAWNAHTKKIDTIGEAVEALAKGIVETKRQAREDHERMRTELVQVNSELTIAASERKAIDCRIAEIRGATTSQQATIVEMISKLSSVTGRLDAFFSMQKLISD